MQISSSTAALKGFPVFFSIRFRLFSFSYFAVDVQQSVKSHQIQRLFTFISGRDFVIFFTFAKSKINQTKLFESVSLDIVSRLRFRKLLHNISGVILNCFYFLQQSV